MNQELHWQQGEIAAKAFARQRFSYTGFALLVMAVLHQGVGLIAMALLGGRVLGNTWLLFSVSFLPLYLIGLPVFVLMMRRMAPMPAAGPKRPVSPGIVALMFFACYAAMVGLNLVGQGIHAFVGNMRGRPVGDSLEGLISGDNIWAVMVFVVILAPVIEEYVFRGLLLKYLGGYGAAPYILFSSFTFGLYHGNIPQILYAFAIGLPLGAVAYYSGRIRHAIVLHMLLNFAGAGVPAIAMRYGGEAALGIMVLVFGGIGLVSGVVLLAQKDRLRLAPAMWPLPRGVLLQNPGTVLFTIFFAGLATLMLLV